MTKPCPDDLAAFKHEPADYEQPVEAVTVLQCDRDAAAEFADCIFCHPDFLVQAFARHRTQANETMRAEVERLSDVLDTERYKVAIGVQAIARAIQGRKWLSEPGRGSYTYDDERYQQEFGAALDEIHDALKPLQAIARDWSDCPRDPLRVEANRRAALSGDRA